MKRSALALALVFCASLVAYGQQPELSLDAGVKPHAGIDAIYRDFSDAYRTLNFEKVARLYTESAAYLVPGQNVMTGRETIHESFRGFFQLVKSEGRNMAISFRILQRKAGKDLAYDVGIYTLRIFRDGKEVSSGQGKFVVVAVEEKDAKWRFQVDGYSDVKPSKPSAN